MFRKCNYHKHMPVQTLRRETVLKGKKSQNCSLFKYVLMDFIEHQTADTCIKDTDYSSNITMLNSSESDHHCLPGVPTVLVWAQIRFHLHTSSSTSSRQAIHRARRGIVGLETTAARHHVSEVGPEWRRVEAVDDRVTACVQVAKDKQYVVHILRCVLDNGWLEPVPDPQEVVGCPTDDKGADNHNGHLEGLHSGFGYHVCSTASQAVLTICRDTTWAKAEIYSNSCLVSVMITLYSPGS